MAGREDGPGLALLFCGILAPAAAGAVTPGGEVGVTSDAIYQGMSESFDRPALLLDLHAGSDAGTFAGAYSVAPLTPDSHPAASHELVTELTGYLGQRFTLGNSWSAQLTASAHHYPGRIPGDYQELMAQVSYLDLWGFSVGAIPDARRYLPPWMPAGSAEADGSTHYLAFVTATQLQWLLTRGLFFTAGAGYYVMADGGVDGSPETAEDSRTPELYVPARGYAYGNAGLAWQWQEWRLDAGYFLAGAHASAQLYRFPPANERVAVTLSWHF